MRPLPLKASQDILRLMHHTYRNQGFQLFFSFFEIYGGKLYDLLNERRYIIPKSVMFINKVYAESQLRFSSEQWLPHVVNFAWEKMENRKFALLVYKSTGCLILKLSRSWLREVMPPEVLVQLVQTRSRHDLMPFFSLLLNDMLMAMSPGHPDWPASWCLLTWLAVSVVLIQLKMINK